MARRQGEQRAGPPLDVLTQPDSSMFFDVDLAVLLFSITLAVEAVGWIGKDTLADVVSPPRVLLEALADPLGPPSSGRLTRWRLVHQHQQLTALGKLKS